MQAFLSQPVNIGIVTEQGSITWFSIKVKRNGNEQRVIREV